MKTFTMSSLVFLIVAIAFIANATGTTLPPTTVSPTTTTPQPTTAVPTTDAPTTTAPSAPTAAAPTTAAPGRPRPEWLKCMATAIKCWEEFPKLGEKEFSELGENGSAEFFACCKEKYQEKFQKKIPEECIKEIEMKNILRKFNQQNSY